MAEKCGAKAKSTGKPCTRPPIPGGVRCRFHGGSAPQVKAAAERRLQVADAAAAVVTFGLPREIDPRDALLEEVYRAAGAVDWLQRQVRALQTDAVVWGKTKEVDRGGEAGGFDITHEATVNLWVELLSKERRHLVDVCKAAVQCGLEERRVRLAEQQGAMLAGVIKSILGDLELTAEQASRVPEIVPRHLRAIA